jgi:hypothetical protein
MLTMCFFLKKRPKMWEKLAERDVEGLRLAAQSAAG